MSAPYSELVTWKCPRCHQELRLPRSGGGGYHTCDKADGAMVEFVRANAESR